MVIVIALLTLVLVLDCLFLVFLVLLQLPKKDAGAGLAFGGAATDALFGAGSGNVLTKITKYAAGTFFIVAIVLALLQARRSASNFEQRLQQAKPVPAAPADSPVVPANTPVVNPASGPLATTNVTIPPLTATNLPPAPAEAPDNPPPAAPEAK